MCLGENNGNLSEAKKAFYSQPFLKMRIFLLDMRRDFLIMSNFYLVEILIEPSNYVLIFSISFLRIRIMNLQCNTSCGLKVLIKKGLIKEFI